MKKPIIGLTTYGRDESRHIPSAHYDTFFYIPTDYVDAVRRAGGVPILLPPGETDWQRWLDAVDGVIVIGGADVSPSEYGGNSDHPDLTILDKERDRSELELIKLLTDEKDRPILCICRGMQAFNVALGGTLHEHVPDIRDEDIHRNEQGGWAMQSLEATPDSQLAKVMQTQHVTTVSGHHQAVDEVAEAAIVTAVAPDGLIEALEMQGHPWAIAVQWHPEKSAATDPTQQRLFDELVATARTHAN